MPSRMMGGMRGSVLILFYVLCDSVLLCSVVYDVLSLNALTLRSTITLSFQYKCQAARRNVYIVEWATPSMTVSVGLVALFDVSDRR